MTTQISPPAASVAILYHPATAPYASRMVRAMEDAAKSIGVTVRDAPCHDDDEIEAVFAALPRGGCGGLFDLRGIFTLAHRGGIAFLALKDNFSTCANTRQNA